MKFIKHAFSKITFWRLLAVFLVFVGIYFANEVFVDQPENARASASMAEDLRQSNIDQCVTNAKQDASFTWDSNCLDEGKDADCNLPLTLANSLNSQGEKAEEDCYTRYSNR